MAERALPHRPSGSLDGPVVEPRRAASAILLRPSRAGLEVLLTRRARSLRFGGDLWVFPGGRADDDEDLAAAAARETREETGIVIDPAGLIPMTRWVTPIGLPIRFDARFFGVVVDRSTEVSAASPEVAESRWLAPLAALEGMAGGDLPMWQPTVVTLQQLEAIDRPAALASAFAASPSSPSPALIGPEQVGRRAVSGDWAGGIAGQPWGSWIVGQRAWVVVNPGDPTGEATAAILAAAAASDATLVGVAITDLEPQHHAGVEMFAAGLGLPVVGPAGAAALAPYPVVELHDGAAVSFGDVALVAREGRAGGTKRWSDRAAPISFEGPGWMVRA